ncbi:MAG: response regulator [Candidatus Sumerlaeaceae bacterium]|nr:response regulator [Candidatus Sumerlaeaceae bacterium]
MTTQQTKPEQERMRVLVIDDDPDILRLVEMSLSSDFDVLTLADPVDALEIMDVFEPDIAVVDIMMPKVTGYQLIELIRQSPKHKHVPILVLSAKQETVDIKYGYKIGANLYLTKPFKPDYLLKNVKMLASALGKPRHKSFSLRDVHLRMRLITTKKIVVSPQAESNSTPVPTDPSTSSLRLRRPLAQEADEQEKKKWMD